MTKTITNEKYKNVLTNNIQNRINEDNFTVKPIYADIDQHLAIFQYQDMPDQSKSPRTWGTLWHLFSESSEQLTDPDLLYKAHDQSNLNFLGNLLHQPLSTIDNILVKNQINKLKNLAKKQNIKLMLFTNTGDYEYQTFKLKKCTDLNYLDTIMYLTKNDIKEKCNYERVPQSQQKNLNIKDLNSEIKNLEKFINNQVYIIEIRDILNNQIIDILGDIYLYDAKNGDESPQAAINYAFENMEGLDQNSKNKNDLTKLIN